MTTPDVVVVGAVLTGGASRRMGRDKALVRVGGRALVAVAADALRGAGADPVLAVGGDREGIAGVAPGTTWVEDRHPGEGPLGGLLTAFAAAAERTGLALDDPALVVVVVACDMPAFDARSAGALVAAARTHPGAAVAAAVVDGRRQPLTAAWRPALAGAHLAAGFDAGERAPRRLLDGLEVVGVEGLDPHALADVDRPEDLHRYAGATLGGRPGPAVRAPGGAPDPPEPPEPT